MFNFNKKNKCKNSWPCCSQQIKCDLLLGVYKLFIKNNHTGVYQDFIEIIIHCHINYSKQGW